MVDKISESGGEKIISEDNVAVSMEIEGEFESVMRKIRFDGETSSDLDVILSDLSVVLKTVIRMEGGTKSAIAEQINDTAIEYDSQAVVDALQVLARYDQVILDGNTWYPGPEATTSSKFTDTDW